MSLHAAMIHPHKFNSAFSTGEISKDNPMCFERIVPCSKSPRGSMPSIHADIYAIVLLPFQPNTIRISSASMIMSHFFLHDKVKEMMMEIFHHGIQSSLTSSPFLVH